MADRGGGGDAGGADRGLGGLGLARVRRMGHQLQYVERPGREDGEIDDDEGEERGTEGGRGERREGGIGEEERGEEGGGGEERGGDAAGEEREESRGGQEQGQEERTSTRLKPRD